ncbi:hypothetical protein [Nonlabens agnitus]|nr:hypothetical protein [Nonlabens agnitus]
MSANDKELLSSMAGDRSRFGEMVNQLAFGMGDKVHLFTKERDTIEMTDFIYPRMYGMSRSTDIMFVYPREAIEKTEEINFTVEDLDLYTGEVRFKMETVKIKNQPKLSFR